MKLCRRDVGMSVHNTLLSVPVLGIIGWARSSKYYYLRLVLNMEWVDLKNILTI